MKEVTYEDWQENPTPREMWVWNYEEDKRKLKVLCIIQYETFPIIATTLDNEGIFKYLHCAEIEKQRRMTNKELARWLREKPTRELKYNHCGDRPIHSFHDYYESSADKEVASEWLIREDDGEWREPLIEEE